MALNPNAFLDGVVNGFSLHIEPPRNAANIQYVFKQHTVLYYSYIRYLLSNVLLFNAILTLDNELLKYPKEMRSVGSIFLNNIILVTL